MITITDIINYGRYLQAATGNIVSAYVSAHRL